MILSVPNLGGGLILQNNLEFHLDENDKIYEGYGRWISGWKMRAERRGRDPDRNIKLTY